MAATFRIVLAQDEDKKYDVHDVREFDLALGSKFVIGRASKNASKGHLLPAKHNVYIDSPVVSREHAVFLANESGGTPHVYISDTGSMHGTMVNGKALVPNTLKQLSNGDKLQFGVGVNRGDCFFSAYEYTFKAELSNSEPFSRGFTVPDADSDEEEVDCELSGPGSQYDPFVLDDSDAQSEQSEEDADVTMAHITPLLDEEDNVEEPSKDDEDDADSITESDVESNEASTGSVAGYSPESPVFGVQVECTEDVTATEQVRVTNADQGRSSATLPAPIGQSLVEQTPATETFQYENFTYPVLEEVAQSSFGKELPPLSMLGQNFGNASYDSTWAPPLPPRPSQKRQKLWDEAPFQQESYQELWPAEESTMTPSYPLAGMPDNMPQLSPDSSNASPSMKSSEIDSSIMSYASAPVPSADRIQTPPPTLNADVVSSTPSPPTRRTVLSITEIVEEQPPTPTSVNSRKRSAVDAFDEEDVTVSTAKIAAPEMAPHPTVEQVAPQSQRAIAQPRSILRRALRAAGLMVPATAFGAAMSIAALTALPESFFTVA
jgi:hypothetical protein